MRSPGTEGPGKKSRDVLLTSSPGAPMLPRPTSSITMTRATTVTIQVPAALRDCCGGDWEFALAATSVRGVLEELERRYPALYRSICDETGTVRRHVNVFVNTAHMRDREGLDTELVPGDVVSILQAVSGG